MAFLEAIAPAVIAGAFSAFGASSQNEEAKHRAIEQMKFQKYMSNTAYQRSMKDMKKAGLNPILAYKQGGASSPGGAMAPTVNELEPAVSSAMQARRLTADLKAIKANTTNLQANTEKTRLDAVTSHETAQLTREQARLTKRQYGNAELNATILGHQGATALETYRQNKIATMNAGANFLVNRKTKKMMFEWLQTTAGKAFWKTDVIGRAINPASSAFRNVR